MPRTNLATSDPLLPAVDDIDALTLPSGETLTRQQTLAIFLNITTTLTYTEIAEQTGYAQAATVSKLIKSERGQIARAELVKTHLSRAGEIGLMTAVQLALSATSEKVRLDAAALLMERSGLMVGTPDQQANKSRSTSVNISFDLSGQPQARVIEPEDNA